MKDLQELEPEPQPPEEKDWGFVPLLKEPLHKPFKWKRREAKPGESSLKDGVRLEKRFPDNQGLLDTAFEDFERFLQMGGIPLNGKYPIAVRKGQTGVFEEYEISVKQSGIEITAGDTEGIRRALVYLEDEILRSGGPFLLPCRIKRTPVIKTRISRSCYAPTDYPSKSRSREADALDYYPFELLNRYAHDGINGLWHEIVFSEFIPSKIILEYGQEGEKYLGKLAEICDRCRLYGIKLYIYCNEPRGFPSGSPMIKKYPQIQGHNNGAFSYFCTSSPMGKAYLEEATYTLFNRVPGLGGLINIPIGERVTNCYSGSGDRKTNNCPRCRRKQPAEVLAETLSTMARGMHRANPSAQLISWHYGQYMGWGEKSTRESAGKMPRNVALQFNFESAGRDKQLGKTRYAGDYWLSYVGPSALFRQCCRNAIRAGNPVFAKIQAGCSHEVATVPWVSVPGNLYRKYRAMHKLGVSGVMQCWYFGAYPGLMTKAAGELSFAPLPKSEDKFLNNLAGCWWPGDRGTAVKAWKIFRDAYSNFPMNALFGYYGPMHDGPVWPLYLRPRNKPLAPTFLSAYPASGDMIGQSFAYTHTIHEILLLCRRMYKKWEKGVKLLKIDLEMAGKNVKMRENLQVDRALGLQFRSGYHIFRFYQLREKLFDMKGIRRLKLLGEMKKIVLSEIETDRELLDLSKSDPRLGFHAEAEIYRYFPEKISWRIRQIEKVLREDFPYAEKEIRKENALFPEYTGEKPDVPVYACMRISSTKSEKGNETFRDRIKQEPLLAGFSRGKTGHRLKRLPGNTQQHGKRFLTGKPSVLP